MAAAFPRGGMHLAVLSLSLPRLTRVSGLCCVDGATADGPWAAQGALGTLVLMPTAGVGCSSPTALDCNSYMYMHVFIRFLEHLY